MPEGSPAGRYAKADDNTMLHVVYGLYAVTFILMFASVIGVFIAYMQRGKELTDMQRSHVTWQIRTFWLVLAVALVSVFLAIFWGVIAAISLLAIPVIFFIYRIAKGWFFLTKSREIGAPASLF